jgi:hypothetical protein
MSSITYTTPGGIGVRREAVEADYAQGVEPLISALDLRRTVKPDGGTPVMNDQRDISGQVQRIEERVEIGDVAL